MSSPFVLQHRSAQSRICRRDVLHRHAVGSPTYPRGPRSGWFYYPNHHHLICPSAPLAGTSRLRRTAAYMRCLSCAGAPRPPASGSGLSLSIPSWHATPYDPGEFDDDKFQGSNVDGAFGAKPASRHSHSSRNPLHAGHQFRGFHGSPICCGLSGCSAPCTDLTGCPANGAFYFQAFNRLVALPVAGYDYSGGWTPPLVGLSPTGTTTRLAARLRMMPTFPRSPLSFRTASFPQYGWKAGFPGGVFPDCQRLKPAPGIRRPPSSLHPPFVHFVVATVVRSESGLRTRSCTAVVGD